MSSSLPDAPRGAVSYDFAGRVAMITGALGDLGSAAASAFAAAGAMVVAVAHAEGPRSEALRTRLGSAAARLDLVIADSLSEERMARAVEAAVGRHGRLDILVNTVGGYTAGEPVAALEEATWQRMLDLNLRSAFLASKHAVAPMLRQRWGRILNISARAAWSGRRDAAAYAVAKAGILTLTAAQAEEVRDFGVTVNALLPGILDTETNRAAMPRADFARWPTPDAVARVLLFLASDDAWLITGGTIPVYGLS
ncbi:MAG: SDR family NAD(P)-dependent oxidoreductase [Ktedonobacterales bacterium]|nr:SDR family NAD(P)-dependent oxidoreductase [Ktedonobacterales bacterium]